MSIREIVTLPHAALRKKARKVADFGKPLQQLVDDMIETMRAAPGVGLAAPQLDVHQRVIVVEFGDEEDPEVLPTLYVVVNPEIKRPSREILLGQEGCLSIPGLVGDVERSASVVVRGQNRRGHPIKIKAEGWLARIFLHEIDHLNGVLFVDKAEKIYKLEELEDGSEVATPV
ncbi:MAG: peptide deformylase [Anaerolineae bacterium]|nr:peptide deformylase [Anaerolineae bacterium]